MPTAGTYGWSGQCDPSSTYCAGVATFSVGIFEWMLTKDRKRLKKSKVKVRVSGLIVYPERVYAKADEIVKALDAGTYDGPKTVRV